MSAYRIGAAADALDANGGLGYGYWFRDDGDDDDGGAVAGADDVETELPACRASCRLQSASMGALFGQLVIGDPVAAVVDGGGGGGGGDFGGVDAG